MDPAAHIEKTLADDHRPKGLDGDESSFYLEIRADGSSGDPAPDSAYERPSTTDHQSAADRKRRERSRLAQSRYRAAKREAQHKHNERMAELDKSISELRLTNSELSARERVMSELAVTQEKHIDLLSSDQRVLVIQQNLLLVEAMVLLCNVYGRTVHSQEALQWKLEDWIRVHFENYLGYLAARLPAVQARPDGPDAQALASMISRRREAEVKLTLYSCLHLALLAWNLEHGPAMAACPQPDTAAWTSTLYGLHLNRQQEQDILAARHSLLQRLKQAQEARRHAYATLRNESQSQASKCTGQQSESEGAQHLEAALLMERIACDSFLMRVGMDILSPLQEAWLDACAPTRPWWPDFYAMSDLLAAQKGEAQAPEFLLLRQQPDDAGFEELMPVLTPFRLLTQPCTSYGSGAHLKRGLLNCRFLTIGRVSPMGVRYQMPTMESLEHATLYEVQSGKYRQLWPRLKACARSPSSGHISNWVF